MVARAQSPSVVRRVEAAARRAAAGRRLVLAVSGGRDSMALLHAMARVAPRSVAVVATFDHGTGRAATRAARLVAADAARLGFPVVVGRAATPGRTEAEWRDARRAFLADVARRCGGVVATAHTRDDQIETVLIRILRDAGPRGLAALYAASPEVRPLLECARADVAAYARDVGARWVQDPTNASPRHLRNRVRRDLLPALVAASPALAEALLAVARDAAGWRARADRVAASLARVRKGGVDVAAASLAGRTPGELAVLWPAIAARVGLAMDWRGTERAALFTTSSRVGARMPLSGGWQIARTRDGFELTRAPAAAPSARPLAPGMRWDGWRFDVAALRRRGPGADPWTARLPADAALTVRRWHPGDRMRLAPGVTRRVKRFLSDARVSGARRGQWPVVLAGDEIVWIPGVRRSDAAAERPGRPGVLYRCELDDR